MRNELNCGAPEAVAISLIASDINAPRILKAHHIVVGIPYLDELKSLDMVDELERRIKKPVVVSNQAMIWETFRLAAGY